MKRVHVLVEGQTEELFVKEVLQPALPSLVLTPILIATKRVKTGGKFKGGVTSFKQVQDDLRRLFKDSAAAAVTTILDLYALPRDFPGLDTTLKGRELASHLEVELHRALGAPGRFIPYLSVHEFEALLFVSPGKAPTVFNTRQQEQLLAIAAAHSGDVELINDGPTTHPSARVKGIVPGYDKVLGGSIAILETGLPAILAACKHFKAWFDRLSAL